jgi:hypothetical protein
MTIMSRILAMEKPRVVYTPVCAKFNQKKSRNQTVQISYSVFGALFRGKCQASYDTAETTADEAGSRCNRTL